MPENSHKSLRRILRARPALASLILVAAGCQRSVDSRIGEVFRLGRQPSEVHRARLIKAMNDSDRDVRTAVLVVMETADSALARELARGALGDPDGFVRAAAVRILGESGDPTLIGTLAACATGDSAWQVRARALEAIASSDDPAVAPAFERALRDPVWHVRRAALAAGAAHPELLPVEEVGALLHDEPDWENRVAAARLLGTADDPVAFPALDAAVHDPNEFVRAAAARSLGELQKAGLSRPVAEAPPTGAVRSGSPSSERKRGPGV